MSPENRIEPIIDGVLKITDNIDLKSITKSVVDQCKKRYIKIMDSCSHWYDKKGVSPNQIVTGRVLAGTTTGAFLASGDYGATIESIGVGILCITFIHDAIDGHLARLTQQTSKNGETLDALGDKVKVFILLAILLSTMDVNPITLMSLLGASAVALVLDIKSQLMRNNNIEAFKACLQPPLNQEARDNNPNEKSSRASVVAGKAKTGVVMTGITLGFMEDIPMFEWTNENAILLLIALVTSIGLAGKSLSDKAKKIKEA